MRELVAVKRIRMVLSAVAGDGYDVVPIPVLRDYLDAVERESDVDVETVKLHQAIESARERIAFDDRVELFRSLIGLGSTTIRSALVLNGGAALAMLAFVGQLAAQSSGTALALRFAWTFAGFGIGAVLAVLAAGFGYLAQSDYHKGRNGLGDCWRRVAVATVLCSLLAFAGGLGGAFYALIAAEQPASLAPAGGSSGAGARLPSPEASSPT